MAAATLQSSASLPLPAGTYIYNLARRSPSQVAATSSDDSLTLLDSKSLRPLEPPVRKVHQGLTALAFTAASAWGRAALVTAGRDGLVKVWDEQAGAARLTLSIDNGQGFSAVAVSGDLIAAGTENVREGAGDVGVYVWDIRSPKTPLRSYTESHNDTITTLLFHPSRKQQLLSGSTDALLTLYDTTQGDDEDDAVLQVFNHSAAVHCATFLSDDEIATVSSDEQLAVYGISRPEDVESETVGAVQTVYGDVRSPLGCAYVIDFVRAGEETWVAAGNLEKQSLTLTPLIRAQSGEATKYAFDHSRTISCHGAHGEEVVRDVLLDTSAGTLHSCGEDGAVKLWNVNARHTSQTRPSNIEADHAGIDEPVADDDDAMDVDQDDGEDAERERRRRKKEAKRNKRLERSGVEKKR